MSLLLDSSIVSSDADFKYACDDPEANLFVENLWNRYNRYADKDFTQKIATRFNDHFWEMFLTCTLEDNGNDLLPKTQRKGPDIAIKSANFSRIWIEAIAASPGFGEDRVPLPNLDLDNKMGLFVPEERIVLRYTTAIDAKHKKYIQYRKDVVSESEPYVIAVNGNKVPYARDDEIPYIVQAVLPFGLPTVQINWDTSDESIHGYDHRPEIKRAKGSDISTNIFLRKEYEGISGVLFSRVGIRDFRSKMGRDFIFVHNPLAQNKLPEGWLRAGYEYRLNGNSLECRRWSR
jgi:hypothetical protein